MLRLAPHACVIRVLRGTDDVLDALREGAAPGPLAAEEQALLVVRAAETLEVTIERLEEGVARVLERASCPTPRPELEAFVVGLGGDPDQAATLIDGLVGDAVLG